MRINRRGIALSALLAAFFVSQLGATSAHADDPPSVVFDEPDTVTAEYGASWSLQATADQTYVVNGPWTGSVVMHGAPSSYHPYFVSFQMTGTWTTVTYVNPSYENPALGVGAYTFDASVTNGYETRTSTTPATLTIVPAPLGIDLRVLADTSNPTGTIVSARFTGSFVDNYVPPSVYPYAAVSPAGEWHITLKDEGGAIAVERNFERSAGDDVLGVSFYWSEAKPDTEYSATAEFVPTGASATNFDIDAATTFTYTPQDDPRPEPSSTVTARPAADLPEPAGFGMPLWSLILCAVLILGLGVLTTILSVRLHKRPMSLAITAVSQ